LCQSASRAKLILGLSSTSKVEDLWTTRLATAYCPRTPFSLIVVALSAMQNSSHLISSTIDLCQNILWRQTACNRAQLRPAVFENALPGEPDRS
jgi:hypothetical protein